MSITLQERRTLRQFLAAPETKPASEYWLGQVRQQPMPTTKHSVIQGQLIVRMTLVAEARKPRRGRALPELRCTFAGRSVVPDLAYVLRERLPVDPDGTLSDRFLSAPDISIEIVSSDQTQSDLTEKLTWCVQNGVRLGWLIDPETQQVLEFCPNAPTAHLGGEAALDGRDILPGFRCLVSEVFGWLRE
jgi:Uma2 family endonuclease